MKPIPSFAVGWTQNIVGWARLCVLSLLAVAVLGASPAAAQDEPDPTGVTVLDDTEEAQPDSEIVRDDETSDTIQGIRRNLFLMAFVSGVGLLVYLWHTSPSRRFRIATARAQDHAATQD